MVVNITHLHPSHFRTVQHVLNRLKDPDPSYSVVKYGDNLSSRKGDMAQHVISRGCELEWSRSSVKVTKFSIRPHHLPISTCVKFHQSLIASFSFTGFQSLTERWPGKKRKKKYKRNNWTDVDTLRRKLRHEGPT